MAPRARRVPNENRPPTRRLRARAQAEEIDSESAGTGSSSENDERESRPITGLEKTDSGKKFEKLFADLNDMQIELASQKDKDSRRLHEANIALISDAHDEALQAGKESEFQDAFCDSILLTVGTPKNTPVINLMARFCVEYFIHLAEIIAEDTGDALLKRKHANLIRKVFDFVAEGADVRNRTYRKRFMKFIHDFLTCKEIHPFLLEQRAEVLPVLIERCKDVDTNIRMMAMSSIREGFPLEEFDDDITGAFEELSRKDPSGSCRARALKVLRKKNTELEEEGVPEPVNEAETRKHWKEVATQGECNAKLEYLPPDQLEKDTDMSEVILKPVVRGVPTIMEDEFDYLLGVLEGVRDSAASVRCSAYSILKSANVSIHTVNKWGASRAEKDNQVQDFLTNRVLKGVNDSPSVRKSTLDYIKSWLPKEKGRGDLTYHTGLVLLLKEFNVMLGADSAQQRTTLPLPKEDAMMQLFNDPAVSKEDTTEWIQPPENGLTGTASPPRSQFGNRVGNDTPRERGRLMAQAMNDEIATQEDFYDRREPDESTAARLLMSEAEREAFEPVLRAMTPEKATYIRLICKRCYLCSQKNAPPNFNFNDAPDINELVTFTIGFFESRIYQSAGEALDLTSDKSTNDFIYSQLLHAISYSDNLETATHAKLRSHVETALCFTWDVGSNSTLLMKVLRRLVKSDSNFLEVARDLFDSISPDMEPDKRWDAQLTMLQAILSNVNYIDINRHESIYSDFSAPVFLCFNQDGRPRKNETAAECMQLMGLLALAFPAKAPNLVQIMVKRYNELMEEVYEKQKEMDADIENARRNLSRHHSGSAAAQDWRAKIRQIELARPIPETWDERRYILQIICDVMLKVNFLYAGCSRIILEGLEDSNDVELQSICCSAAAKLVFADVWAPHEDNILSVFVRLYYQQLDYERSPRSHDTFSVTYSVVETLEFFFAFYHRVPENAMAIAQIFPSVIFETVKSDLDHVVEVQGKWRAYDDSRNGEIDEPENQLQLEDINGYFARFRTATSNYLTWSNNTRKGEVPEYNSHAIVMIAFLKELIKVSPKVEKETEAFHALNRNSTTKFSGTDMTFYRVYDQYADSLCELAREIAVNDCSTVSELKTMIELATEILENSCYVRKNKLIITNLLTGFEKLRNLVVARVGSPMAEDNSEAEFEQAEDVPWNRPHDQEAEAAEPQFANASSVEPEIELETPKRTIKQSPQSPAILDGLSSDDDDEVPTAGNTSALFGLDVSSIIAGVESTPRTTPRSSLAAADPLTFDDDSSLLADQSSVLETPATPVPTRSSRSTIKLPADDPETVDLLGSDSDDSISVVAVVEKTAPAVRDSGVVEVKSEKNDKRSKNPKNSSDSSSKNKKLKKKRKLDDEGADEKRKRKKKKSKSS